MVVRIERTHDGSLAQRTQGFELKAGSGGTAESFQKQRGVLAYQESAVAYRLQTFGSVRNRGVQTVADFTHRREPFIHDRRLGYARIACQGFGQRRKWQELVCGEERTPLRSATQKIASRK